MKPGKICKKSGKIAYGSHDEAVRKQMAMDVPTKAFSAYLCPGCKCWHITTKVYRPPHERISYPEDNLEILTR